MIFLVEFFYQGSNAGSPVTPFISFLNLKMNTHCLLDSCFSVHNFSFLFSSKNMLLKVYHWTSSWSFMSPESITSCTFWTYTRFCRDTLLFYLELISWFISNRSSFFFFLLASASFSSIFSNFLNNNSSWFACSIPNSVFLLKFP